MASARVRARFRAESIPATPPPGGTQLMSRIYLGHSAMVDGVYKPSGLRTTYTGICRIILSDLEGNETQFPVFSDVMGEPIILPTGPFGSIYPYIKSIRMRHPDFINEDWDTGPHVENAPTGYAPMTIMGNGTGPAYACGIYNSSTLAIAFQAGSGLGATVNGPPPLWTVGTSVFFCFAYYDGSYYYPAVSALVSSIANDGMSLVLTAPLSGVPNGARVYGCIDNANVTPPVYTRHGIRKNPVYDTHQPYDARISTFTVTKVATIPIALAPGDALIIANSRPHNDPARLDVNNSALAVAKELLIGSFVITCMASAPAADSYRPSPYDRAQHIYRRADHVSALPNLSTNFSGAMQISNIGAFSNRYEQYADAICFHSIEHIASDGETLYGLHNSSYYRERNANFSDIACLLCFGGTGRQTLVDAVFRNGIDAWYAIKSMAYYNLNTATTETCYTLSDRIDKSLCKFPIVFAGWLLNNTEIGTMTSAGTYPTGGKVISAGGDIQYFKTDLYTYYGADRTPAQAPWTGWADSTAMYRLADDPPAVVRGEFDNLVPYDFFRVQNKIALGFNYSSAPTQTATICGWTGPNYASCVTEELVLSAANTISNLVISANTYDRLQYIKYTRVAGADYAHGHGLAMFIGTNASETLVVEETNSADGTPIGPVTYYAYNWASGNGGDHNYLMQAHGYSMQTNIWSMIGQAFFGLQVAGFKTMWQHDAFFDLALRWMKEANVAWGIYYYDHYITGGKAIASVIPAKSAASNVTGSMLFLSGNPDLADIQDGKCPIWVDTPGDYPAAATIIAHDNVGKTVTTRIPLPTSGTSCSWTLGFDNITNLYSPVYKLKGFTGANWNATGTYPPGSTCIGHDFQASSGYSFIRNAYKAYVAGVVD